MKKTIFHNAIIVFIFVLVGCSTNRTSTPSLPWNGQTSIITPTPTITLTLTPTLVDAPFWASIYEDASCLSGANVGYQELIRTPRGKIVMVLGINERNGGWFLVRLKDFAVDCWIEVNLLVPDFDQTMLPIVSTPDPITPTPTKVVLSITPSQTRRPSDHQDGHPNYSSDTPKPPEPSDIPKPPEPSNTPKPPEPSDTPKPPEPSDTPKPPEPSDTPKPPEPSNTPKPPNTPCKNPNNPNKCPTP